MRRVSLGLCLLALAACADPEPLPFVVRFSVTADQKTPVAGAQIAARSKQIGITSAAGELQAPLRGFEGDRVPVTLTCPSGYAPSPAESVIILRSVPGLDGEKRKPIDHALGCQPSKRDAVVLVHVSGAATSLPVKVDGALVGQTDGLGFAHLHLRPDPGQHFEVAIDTSSNEKLMPQNPQQVFQVDTHDELFVFDREFELPPKAKSLRRRSRSKSQAHVPIHLD
jgi:hypothetical protein